MYKINKELLKTIELQFKKIARPLEISYFDVLFNGNSADEYLNELAKFQNDDGGFGKGIESDLRYPFSCALSTSVGIRYALRFEKHPMAEKIIEKSIRYLDNTYDVSRVGWFSVGKDVNNYPHSPWWHWDDSKGMTAIDNYWGNPSAEILGYIIKYEKYIKNIDIEVMKKHAKEHIQSIKKWESFHELYCYSYLIETIENDYSKSIVEKVSEGINVMVNKNIETYYKDYSPVPLNFINDLKFTYGIEDRFIQENVEVLLNRFEHEIVLTPNWDWNDELYKKDMKIARNEWKGVLTIDALKKLLLFDRIEL